MAVSTRSESYPSGPGVAMLVNIIRSEGNKLRRGAQHDSNHYKCLFGMMGYKIREETDVTFDEFQGSLRIAMGYFVEPQFSTGPFFLCIMCHGTGEDGLTFSDGKTVSTKDILSWFTEDFCKNLEGRPKVVLIQACRGNEMLVAEPDGTVRKKTYQPDSATVYDRSADILVFRSCVDGRISFRSEECGSPFVAHFCHVVASFISKNTRCEVQEVAREVINNMKKLIQFRGDKVFATPEITKSSLSKNLYLSVPDKNKEVLKSYVEAMRKQASLHHGDLADDSTGCRCKGGCSPTSKCGCRRNNVPCVPGCHRNAQDHCTNRGCSCASTCATNACRCYKADISCGEDCHPNASICENSGGAHNHGSQVTNTCGCKTGCGTRRCGCVRTEKDCGSECHPGVSGCQNTRERDSSARKSTPSGGSKAEDKVTTKAGTSSAGEQVSCGCKTGCGTRRCGCVKAEKGCGSECHPSVDICQNTGGGGSTEGSTDSEESQGSGSWTDSEVTNTCGCKTGCGTRRCGCVKAETDCGSECHPGVSGCQNTRERDSSTRKSTPSGGSKAEDKVATKAGTSSAGEQVSCGCKTGCGTRRCGCVKAEKGCGSECHPSVDICVNQAGGTEE